MKWIRDFQLYLFDFDGLLVDTEMVHYRAYQKMCERRGYLLDWTFDEYIQIAHFSAEGLEKEIYARFPELKEKEGRWSVLYKEKRDALLQMYRDGEVALMPGVHEFLTLLHQERAKMCVVTHSDSEQVKLIRTHLPILDRINYWVTRYDYIHPKPHPDAYLTAIEKYAKNNDRIIGFEDSPRGMRALLGTEAKPVFVSKINYPELEQFRSKGVIIVDTFESFLRKEQII